jgi:hypothetical protein
MEQPTTPIVCDLTSAPDTGPQRLAEYGRLFTHALIGRDRTPDIIRFRFRADDGVEAWVRDLAAREKACCAFFDFTVETQGKEVIWAASVIDDDIARAILDEFYHLPDTVAVGVDGLEDRLRHRGLLVIANPAAAPVERAPRGRKRRPEPEPRPRR